MPIADEPHFTVTQSPVSDSREYAYIVTLNDMGQYAIWPATRPVPAGWHIRSASLSLGACRALVTRAWPGILPGGALLGSPPPDGGDPDAPGRPGPWWLAARDPGATAVRDADRLTYGQLQRAASQLAHALRARGAGPGTVIGSGLERGRDSIRALLGILTAGGAYLPMEPSLPPPRGGPGGAAGRGGLRFG